MNKAATFGMAACATIALAACSSYGAGDAPAGPPPMMSASADLRDVHGQQKAQATVTEVGDSIRVRVDAINLPQGSYGTHIHTTGRCDPPDFTSAGPHWNPTGQQHGKNNPQGMHKGDLPNLLVGTDGRGSFEFTVPMASVGGAAPPLLDADGAAVVIHAQADDLRTDPSGNSGARIACGVLR